MTIQDLTLRKAALRKEMRERLRDCHGDAGELIAGLRSILGELQSSRRIAIYSALPDEPRISPLVTEMPQHHWLFPRVDGEHLHFHRVWDPASQLKPGAFGILEPDSSLPTTACADIDIFICPGLAFDPAGGRLGRGRGFYDRLLADAREDALKIGVGFACQLVDETFSEPHDILMNAVLCHG